MSDHFTLPEEPRPQFTIAQVFESLRRHRLGVADAWDCMVLQHAAAELEETGRLMALRAEVRIKDRLKDEPR